MRRYQSTALVGNQDLLDPPRHDLADKPVIEVERGGATILDTTINPLSIAGDCNKLGPSWLQNGKCIFALLRVFRLSIIAFIR
jgi:hypothetical protein